MDTFNYFVGIYLVAVVRPRAEFHKTRLLIEREIANVDFARRFEDGWRCPHHFAGMMKHSLCHGGDHVLSVGADTK